MKKIKNEEYIWERISDAWDYIHIGDTESWEVKAHAVGTAGNLSKYAYCREIHENGEVYLLFDEEA